MSETMTHIETKKNSGAEALEVPELRFKEFDGEWQKKKLGDLSERIGDGLHGTPEYVDESEIYFVNGNNLTNGKVVISDNTKKVSTNTFKKNNKGLTDNTLLISLNGTIGNIARYKNERIMLGKSIGYFNFRDESEYYYHVLNSPITQRFFISELTGSTIKNLSLKTLRETTIPFPSLPEQQKIASFLSAVDEKIQQLTKKKELLEQYKKGVMQKLFSQELRFKDDTGKDYPDWEEKRLGEVCIVNPKSKELPANFVYIDLESVEDGRLIKENKIDLIDAPSRAQRSLEVDDILYQTVRPYQKNNLYFNKIGEYVASSGYAQLRAKKSAMYIFQLMHFDGFVNKVLIRCTGTSYPAINSTDLAKIIISFPCLEEQQKIATFLSSIDAKIESVNQQIIQTQTFKKGLLQKMFV